MKSMSHRRIERKKNKDGSILTQIYYSFGGVDYLHTEYNEVRGLLSGRYKTFHPNGSILSESSFVNGVMLGAKTTYRMGDGSGGRGSIVSIKFADGNHNISETFYDERGKITHHETFGPLQTKKRTKFYSNGSVESTTEYKGDKRHGRFRRYDENGKLISTRKYVSGVRSDRVVKGTKIK